MALRKLSNGGPGPINPRGMKTAINKALFDADFPITPMTKDALLAKSSQPISTVAPGIKSLRSNQPFDWEGTAKKLGKIAPYASNLMNMFRKPPAPYRPHLDGEVGGGRHINMDNARYQVERGIRGSNLAADRSLDENTAAAVKMANLATGQGQLSTINQTETNANIGIDNAGKELDAKIRAGNNAKLDGYNDKLVERGVAMQNNASANFANASDKYVAIQNQKGLQDLENRKVDLLYKTDAGYRGTLTRLKDGTVMDASGNPVQSTATEGLPATSGENTPIPQSNPVKQKNAWEYPNFVYPKQSTRVRFRAMGGRIKSFNSKRMMSVHR